MSKIPKEITEKNFNIGSHDVYLFPCIGVCSIDSNSGYCIGCFRTLEEVYKWEDTDTSEEWKLKNEEMELMIEIRNRNGE